MSPLVPASSSSPRSLRSDLLIPAATWPAVAPSAAPEAPPIARPAPIATAGNSATSAPTAIPTARPAMAPCRVGSSTFVSAVEQGWVCALLAPAWEGPPVWHHGDLDARNWLVRVGRICAVIDWEAMGVGDPACDVMVAWKLHSGEAETPSARRCRSTTQRGSVRAGGPSRRPSRPWPTTRRRTSRRCIEKPKHGSSSCWRSVVERLRAGGSSAILQGNRRTGWPARP